MGVIGESWAKQESELGKMAADFRARTQRCADEGSAVGTREWLEAVEKASAAAAHIASIRAQARR